MSPYPFAHGDRRPGGSAGALPGLHLAPDLEALLAGGDGGVDILLGRAGHLAQRLLVAGLMTVKVAPLEAARHLPSMYRLSDRCMHAPA